MAQMPPLRPLSGLKGGVLYLYDETCVNHTCVKGGTCTRRTTCDADECGTAYDGCDGTIECGNCTAAGDKCVSNKCVYASSGFVAMPAFLTLIAAMLLSAFILKKTNSKIKIK